MADSTSSTQFPLLLRQPTTSGKQVGYRELQDDPKHRRCYDQDTTRARSPRMTSSTGTKTAEALPLSEPGLCWMRALPAMPPRDSKVRKNSASISVADCLRRARPDCGIGTAEVEGWFEERGGPRQGYGQGPISTHVHGPCRTCPRQRPSLSGREPRQRRQRG